MAVLTNFPENGIPLLLPSTQTRTVIDEEHWLLWLRLLGWGVPLLVMIPYVAFR